jgi:hypothetical protein
MTRKYCFSVLTLYSLYSFSQKYEARIGVNQGLNSVFIGAVPNSLRLGQSTSLLFAFVVKPKQSSFCFHSSLAYVYHAFNSKANKFLSLSYPQSNWCLTLQTGVNVKKHLVVKAGCFMQYSVPDNKYKIYLTDRSGTGTYLSGFEDLYAGYKPSTVQGGVQFGFTVGLGEKEVVALDFQLLQYGTGISNSDYYLVHASPIEGRQMLISKNAKPTVLFAGLSFRINKEHYKKQYPVENSSKPWML